MARQGTLIVLSLALHGALAAGLSVIRPEQSRAATAIEIANVKKPKATPPPPKIDPPPAPKEKKPAARAARPAPAPPTEAPPPEPQRPAPTQALPDFGLTLSGGIEGTGIALPSGGSTRTEAPRRAEPVRKAPPSVAANPLPSPGGCEEPPTKPKPKNVPQPGYPDSARAAGIEGKVRVELTVDERGEVVSVRVLQGLGHGLDEAALAAARRATFEPALRCGKPTRATFTISMRFSAI